MYNHIDRLSKTRKRSIAFLIILVAIFAGSIVIENADLPFGICLFKTLTKIPCPSCGMTHSFVSMGHLRIKEGFYHNIIGPILYLCLLAGIVITSIEIYKDRLIIEPLFKRYEKKIIILTIILVLISWCFNIYKTIG